ncbi:Zn-dependent protease (includes SpoIVFB) [Syntrophus gentianae]|uniref:Zinc metalloprotease n=1 Tax=Syntrophus gentianae TaxID=43775 RepID=A0A1H7Y858_9BACT|nr:site-2 protease family protein [Syntrophus gentianae]SEM41517.1 Zn-dependent protease (includes SpoIVFB) [Syntrophus gentianae]
MFGNRITLFKLLGFEVRIDASWLLLALLVTWSLAKGIFPGSYKGASEATYWAMGVFGALGLFLSIIFHELCHSLVAARYGIPMKGITLFIFGGVAEMDNEPPSARSEFFMAIAGPLASLFLSLTFHGIAQAGKMLGWPGTIPTVTSYLGFINLLLASFNLIPAFPLDGGRVLRSILWGWKGNLRWATRISSGFGSAFGMLLMLLGIFSIFRGNFIGGVWWLMIGFFLRNAAQMSYSQIIARKVLEGEKVRRFMVPDPVSVSRALTLEEFVNDYVYRYHFKMFPVVSFDRLVGCITVRQAAEIPREEWREHTVGEIVAPCTPDITIGPDEDAVHALAIMSRTANSRLLVVEGERLVGIITLKDMLQFLSLKLELRDWKA